MGYKINPNKVVSEVFDDEAIVVNLENGAYYSFRMAAVSIWRMIEAGYNYEQVNINFEQDQVNSFLDFIKTENLIISDDSIPGELIQIKVIEGQTEYRKYDDMKDLLLLDPIHEVAPKGWPNKIADE